MRRCERLGAVWALVIAALAPAVAPAAAEEAGYRVSGSDTFAIGAGDQRGVIQYDGAQILKVEHKGKAARFTAHVRYEKIDQGAKSQASGNFIEEIAESGDSQDLLDEDPDFLTILNQPFSIQLDGAAMHALEQLKASVPFEFPAPMVNASLQGRLARTVSGSIRGRPALGLTFSAQGPMRGRVLTHPMSLVGNMKLEGRAYYDSATALLLALDLTLEISGRVIDDATQQPVRIIFRRSIRLDPDAVKEASLQPRNAKP